MSLEAAAAAKIIFLKKCIISAEAAVEDERRFNFCFISAAAAVGVEDKQRFNFGFAASIQPQTAAGSTRNRRNSHSGVYLTF